jgi:hypothetical protein
VSADDLARVASTPAELPPDLPARLAGWQAATDLRGAADAELARCRTAPPHPDDPLVATFAALDQPRLWEAHAQLARADDAYARLSDQLVRTEPAPEVEARIESAHLEVVRCERDAQRRFRPGMLGAGALAVGALLAGQSTSVVVAALMLLASVAMATWLVAERMELLDLVVRLSAHVQVVLLSDDPVVARWARDRARGPAVTLYEALPEPAATPASAPAPSTRSAELPAWS